MSRPRITAGSSLAALLALCGLSGCLLIGYPSDGAQTNASDGAPEVASDAKIARPQAGDAGGLDASIAADGESPLDADGSLDGAPVPDTGSIDAGPEPAGDARSIVAPPDAYVSPDAGACIDQDCSPMCSALCAVADCYRAKTCNATCGTLSVCDVDCQSAASCALSCASQATCHIGCHGATKCDTTCALGSNCQVDCSGTAECSLSCAQGAFCGVDCRGSSQCTAIHCPANSACVVLCDPGSPSCSIDCVGAAGTCPDGSQICNSTCP